MAIVTVPIGAPGTGHGCLPDIAGPLRAGGRAPIVARAHGRNRHALRSVPPGARRTRSQADPEAAPYHRSGRLLPQDGEQGRFRADPAVDYGDVDVNGLHLPDHWSPNPSRNLRRRFLRNRFRQRFRGDERFVMVFPCSHGPGAMPAVLTPTHAQPRQNAVTPGCR